MQSIASRCLVAPVRRAVTPVGDHTFRMALDQGADPLDGCNRMMTSNHRLAEQLPARFNAALGAEHRLLHLFGRGCRVRKKILLAIKTAIASWSFSPECRTSR